MDDEILHKIFGKLPLDILYFHVFPWLDITVYHYLLYYVPEEQRKSVHENWIKHSNKSVIRVVMHGSTHTCTFVNEKLHDVGGPAVKVENDFDSDLSYEGRYLGGKLYDDYVFGIRHTRKDDASLMRYYINGNEHCYGAWKLLRPLWKRHKPYYRIAEKISKKVSPLAVVSGVTGIVAFLMSFLYERNEKCRSKFGLLGPLTAYFSSATLGMLLYGYATKEYTSDLMNIFPLVASPLTCLGTALGRTKSK